MPFRPPSMPPSPNRGDASQVLGLMTTEAHRMLGWLLGVLLLALPLMMVGEWLGSGRPAELAIFAALTAWIALLALAHRRGRDGIVIGGLVCVLIAAATLFGIALGSVRTVGTIALPGAIVMAGIFLGGRALVATLAACSVVVGALIVAQGRHWLPEPRLTVDPIHWLEYTVVFVAIALIVWFARRVAVQASQQALTGEAWLQTVLRSAPFALIVSSLDEERILEINAAGERIFRVQRDAVVGRSSLELDLWLDAGERTRLLETVRRDGRVSQMPLRMRRADGEAFDALASAELIDSAGRPVMVITVVDASAENRARHALESSESRFRRLFDETPVATLITSYPEGRFAACNDAFAELVGLARAAIIGHTVVGMKLWYDSSEREAAFARLQREGAVRNQPLRLLRPDGQVVHCLLNWVFIETDGERFVLGQLVDISARLASEQALRELNEGLEARVQARTAELAASNAALAEARDAAEAATRVKSQFLANMSHEIRTPLNAVVGLTDLALRDPQLPPAVDGHLRQVKQAAAALLEIIGRILDFSRIEAGGMQLENAPFALDEVLAQVCAVVGIAAQAKGLSLQIERADALPQRRQGDALRLTQVLVNLAGNALKFTAAGGVRIVVEQAPAASDGRACLRFAVHDSGIGIAEDKLQYLFRPFDQIDGATTRRYGGTGLGLAISRELVRLMGGGEIEVESRAGLGSSFAFTLPLPCAAPADQAPAAAGADDADLQALRGRRILLAEDNELNQLVARGFLEDLAGAKLEIVATGAAALDALQAADFDLVLMDVQMPVMDGLEATRRLRLDPRHAALPVIAMTAHAQPSDRERSIAAGMNGHLTKPFQARELFATLAAALRRP